MTVTETTIVLPERPQPQLVRTWINRGLLPARQLPGMRGARYRIDKKDLLRFAAEQLQYNDEELAALRARIDALPDTPQTKGPGGGRPRGGGGPREPKV